MGNLGVYVYDEREQPHHLPHAHIKVRGGRVASIFLLSLEVYDNRNHLLRLWQELNGDD
jgi:hypothetical protein